MSEFRHRRKIYKSRSINEFHHAQDAYLNIVVGNVYDTKFTQNPLHFIKKEYAGDAEKNNYNLSRMFDWDVIRGDRVAWIAQKQGGPAGTIATVKEMISRNTPLMTRLSFEGHGGIANETLYGAKKASREKYIPLKATDKKMQDVTKYGGFTSAATAYFFLVEYKVKGKKVRSLETVPVYMKEKIETDPNVLLWYCSEVLGLENPDIRLKKIKLQSLIKKDGFFAYISGRTENRISLYNAVNLCLSQEWIGYVKKLDKYNEFSQLDRELTKEKNEELYQELMEKHRKGIYARRPNSMGEKLINAWSSFEQLELEKQCEVLVQIIKLSSIGAAVSADLTLVGAASKCGTMKISKNISDANEFILINQSVTGLFERRIDLQTV